MRDKTVTEKKIFAGTSPAEIAERTRAGTVQHWTLVGQRCSTQVRTAQETRLVDHLTSYMLHILKDTTEGILTNNKKTGEMSTYPSTGNIETRRTVDPMRCLLAVKRKARPHDSITKQRVVAVKGRILKTYKDLLHLLNIKQLLKVHHRYILDCNF